MLKEQVMSGAVVLKYDEKDHHQLKVLLVEDFGRWNLPITLVKGGKATQAAKIAAHEIGGATGSVVAKIGTFEIQKLAVIQRTTFYTMLFTGDTSSIPHKRRKKAKWFTIPRAINELPTDLRHVLDKVSITKFKMVDKDVSDIMHDLKKQDSMNGVKFKQSPDKLQMLKDDLYMEVTIKHVRPGAYRTFIKYTFDRTDARYMHTLKCTNSQTTEAITKIVSEYTNEGKGIIDDKNETFNIESTASSRKPKVFINLRTNEVRFE